MISWLFYLKISDISQQYQKKRYEYIRNSSELFVSCALCLEPLLFALFGFFSLFAGHILPLDIPPHSPVGFSLLVTVLSSFSQYPLPRLLLKYTVLDNCKHDQRTDQRTSAIAYQRKCYTC